MHTTIVTASLSREAGGLHFAVSRLARGLCDQGLKISVHGLRDRFSEEDLSAWQPATCALHQHKGPRALGYSPSLNMALAADSPDLIHTHGIWQWPSSTVHHWHIKTGNPYLVSPHGMLDSWALAQSKWKKRIASLWYETAHLRDAACIHALCESEAQSMRAYGLKNPICIIPNGVDLPEIGDQGAGVRRQETGTKTLLFLGRIHPKKGLMNALRAWKQALHSTSNIQHSTFHEWQFVIAGWDQNGHEAELKRLCDELRLAWADGPNIEHPTSNIEHRIEEMGDLSAQQAHLGPQGKSATVIDTPLQSSLSPLPLITDHCSLGTLPSVLFLGPAFGDAKDALLRRADAFILPSFSEGLPMSVLEAWSYQLPVLMTDHCNLPEGFANNAAIRIGTDVESIAEGMLLIVRSPISDLRSLGENGRQLVSERFTWPMVAAQMKEVYEWVLGRGAAPGCVR